MARLEIRSIQSSRWTFRARLSGTPRLTQAQFPRADETGRRGKMKVLYRSRRSSISSRKRRKENCSKVRSNSSSKERGRASFQGISQVSKTSSIPRESLLASRQSVHQERGTQERQLSIQEVKDCHPRQTSTQSYTKNTTARREPCRGSP